MSFTELFALLVIRKKVMSMTEFYEADVFDIDLVCSHLEEADRDNWEMSRQIVWAALAPFSKTKFMPEEVLTFSWEKDKSQTSRTTTKEDFERAFKNYIK